VQHAVEPMLGPGPRVIALFESGALTVASSVHMHPRLNWAGPATDGRYDVQLNDATWGDAGNEDRCPADQSAN
jgi:hypothetical protein